MEHVEMAGQTVIVWFVVGIIRSILWSDARAWLHASPERTWAIVYAAAAVVLLTSGTEIADVPLGALLLAVAAVGTDTIRRATPARSVDELIHRDG